MKNKDVTIDSETLEEISKLAISASSLLKHSLDYPQRQACMTILGLTAYLQQIGVEPSFELNEELLKQTDNNDEL